MVNRMTRLLHFQSWRIQIVLPWARFLQRSTPIPVWNINLFCFWDHFCIRNLLVSVFLYFLLHYFISPPIHVCAHYKIRVLEQEVFRLTILSGLKRPLADMLEVWKNSEDLHTHIHTHTCSFVSLWSSDSNSASSPLLNPEIIIIYHNRGSHPPNENKSLPAMLRSYSIQGNFSGNKIAQIKLRESSLAWISTVIAQEGERRSVHCLSVQSHE